MRGRNRKGKELGKMWVIGSVIRENVDLGIICLIEIALDAK